MMFWTRDPGFYHTPVIKSLVVLTSASSLLHSLSILKRSYPAVVLVHVWAFPTVGLWLAAALILYRCRVIERRHGSTRFLNLLLVSGAASSALCALLVSTREYTGLSLKLIPGAIVHSLIGILALEHMAVVNPTHSRVAGFPLSSNFLLYGLISIFSATSVTSLVLTASGLLGGLIIKGLGVPILPIPSWLGSFFKKLLSQDPPPRLYSGASLSVQAQQRTDEIEQLMAAMYNRQQQQRARRIVIGHPTRQLIPPPPENQVEQLLSMGFSRQECVQALQHTGNMEAAIQLLTARHHT